MLLECSAVICMGQQAMVPNSSDPPAATRGAGIPRSPCFFTKGIISKSEFPEQGRGQVIRLQHLLKQMRVCHDQLGPVAPDGCGCWTGGKRNDGYVWGGGHEAHHMLDCPGVQHTDQDGDPPVGGSWPLVSGDASLLLCPPVSQHPDPGPAHSPVEGGSHWGLAHRTQPQPNFPQWCRIRQCLLYQQR